LTLLGKLASEFNGNDPGAPVHKNLQADLSELISLLLRREVSNVDLSSAEVLQRLAESLNTIFDSLNQLVREINETLLGDSACDLTIRGGIERHLKGKDHLRPLESYIEQIHKAFLTSHRAFKRAVHSKVNEILAELDPDKIAAAGGRRLKLGPLRKAEFFEIYEEKYQKCLKWFESGRFMEGFLREFEKNCREIGN
jgi:hypothetical protein